MQVGVRGQRLRAKGAKRAFRSKIALKTVCRGREVANRKEKILESHPMPTQGFKALRQRNVQSLLPQIWKELYGNRV